MLGVSAPHPPAGAIDIGGVAQRRVLTPATRRGMTLGVLYLLICLIWGTTWIGIKYGVETIPPLTAAGLRFLCAFPLLVVVVGRWPGAQLRYPPGSAYLFVFVTLVYLIVPYALLNFGGQHITSGLTAILFSTVSAFLVVFAWLLLGARIALRQWVGVFLGIALLAILIQTGQGGLAASSTWAPLAILLAAMLHGLSYIVIRKYGGAIHPLTLEALPIGVAGVLLTVGGFLLEQPDISSFSERSMWGILYLAVIPSVAGFAIYFYLLKHIEPVTLSFVFIFFPAIALVVSALAEHASFPTVSLLLVVGMLGALALTKTRDEPEPEPEVATGDPNTIEPEPDPSPRPSR